LKKAVEEAAKLTGQTAVLPKYEKCASAPTKECKCDGAAASASKVGAFSAVAALVAGALLM
jgi:hypothetical protein